MSDTDGTVAADTQVPDALRRLLSSPRRSQPGEACEMCAETITAEHSHIIDLEMRSIMCACRGCYLLFTNTDASQRYRAVPERYLHAASFPRAQQLWDSAGIPVGMAFLFRNSVQQSTMCFYPSPAGPTESLLPLGAWDDMLAANDDISTVCDDVEALLLNRRDDGFECFLVPIDTCYELVGLVRMNWKGFDGGSEAWQAINEFFQGLRERCKPAQEAS